MIDIASNNKRVAKNTLYLYLRTFITMAINIYISRIVLKELGVEDYGIYNVVGGFVAMLSMFSNSLSASSQRFFAYEMGQEKSQLNRIFAATLSVHFIITFGLLCFFETFGLWFLNNQMNIDVERIRAANWVFQCSILSFSINLISVPYVASIIAHEKMSAFAFISIYEAVAKLALVYALVWVTSDKLIVYAIFMLCVALSLRIIYGIYCRKKFQETRFSLLWDKQLYKTLLSFTGWNVFGATAGILNTYGINILVNIFFNVTFNAARGIAEQVSHAVNHFVSNFTMALNPQITKNFSSHNFEYTSLLVTKGAKYSALLLWFLGFPVIIQVDFILDVWLVDVPDYAALFVQLALIYTLCNSLSLTLYYGILATGEIRNYHIIVTIINLLAFPLCYVLFRLGMGAEWGYLSAIISMFLSLFARVFILSRKLPGFTIRGYLKDALFRVSLVLVFSSLIAFPANTYLNIMRVYKFFTMVSLVIVVNLITIYYVGLDRSEKQVIKKYCSQLLHKYIA